MSISYIPNSAEFRNQIIITQELETMGPVGPVTSFVPFVTCRASIKPMTGSEIYRAAQYTTETDTTITTWYFEGLQTGMQVQYGTRNFIVKYALNEGNMNRIWVIYCKEINNN